MKKLKRWKIQSQVGKEICLELSTTHSKWDHSQICTNLNQMEAAPSLDQESFSKSRTKRCSCKCCQDSSLLQIPQLRNTPGKVKKVTNPLNYWSAAKFPDQCCAEFDSRLGQEGSICYPQACSTLCTIFNLQSLFRFSKKSSFIGPWGDIQFLALLFTNKGEKSSKKKRHKTLLLFTDCVAKTSTISSLHSGKSEFLTLCFLQIGPFSPGLIYVHCENSALGVYAPAHT